MNKTLVLFTTMYPYYGGEQFLETEIGYLSSQFDKIIIVPENMSENIREVPDNITIDNGVAFRDKSKLAKIKALFTIPFITNLSLNMKENRFLFTQTSKAISYRKWIESFIQNNELETTLFYTYWFTSATLSLSLCKDRYKQLKFVTRAHGYDLYESRYDLKKFPLREKIIKNIDKVYTISKMGKEHLLQRYAFASEKFEIQRLGIKPHNQKSVYSNDNILRIVSCSNLVPLKRVSLLVEAFRKINFPILWTHIGDGPLRKEIEIKISTLGKKNITYHFTGSIPNEQIYTFYRDNPVDLFINVSSSEGIPVTIMEAQSFAIPTIATDVGGTREIVNSENGHLLPADITADDIAKSLIQCYDNKEQWRAKKEFAIENWHKHYNAENNYKVFSKILREL